MKNMLKLSIAAVLLVLPLFGLIQCKAQKTPAKAPFEITEKTYFYVVGGKEGSSGTNIKVVGTSKTRDLIFSAIFFQNHEYKIVPEFKGEVFVLQGSHTVTKRKDFNMVEDARAEYGNEAPKFEKKIPFELTKNEAVLVYRINGKEYFHKITHIKQLDTVYYP
ncbi:MAG: hypothetical protein OEM04_05555 [Flavobacteriaceae bacterium]|nr:hypothetical protein [Flavobacteriaceae bacterium]